MTTATHKKGLLDIDRIAAEAVLAARGELPFGHFLRYVRVQDPPRMEDLTGAPAKLRKPANGAPKAGIKTFEMWPHIEEIVSALADHRRIVWLKARQIGATTILAAYSLWSCYDPYANVLLFSQGESEAEEFLAKCNLIYQYLPEHLRLESIKDNMGLLAFDNGSRIRAFPSTKKAGHGQTATLLIMDEADRHEYFKAGYGAAMPAADGGGQVVIVSTPNPESSESGFKKLCREATAKGFYSLFFNWEVVPGRDQRWYNARKAEALDQVEFEKSYPNNWEEALAPSKELASFNVETLEWMRQFVCEPMVTDFGGGEDGSDGYINIYQKYTEQERYIAATDTSHGLGEDYSCTVVMTKGGTVVADILDRNISPEELATHSMRLLGMYHNPWWAIEDNDDGITVVRAAERRRYPRQYRQRSSRGNEREGWHADSASRPEMWGDFKAAVNSGTVRIPSADGLKQFFDVQKVRREGRLARDEAIAGGNDDYPTAVGVAWFIRDKAYTYTNQAVQPVW